MTEPPTLEELERALVDAVLAGAMSVARALGAALEERRAARTRGNVVPFRGPR